MPSDGSPAVTAGRQDPSQRAASAENGSSPGCIPKAGGSSRCAPSAPAHPRTGAKAPTIAAFSPPDCPGSDPGSGHRPEWSSPARKAQPDLPVSPAPFPHCPASPRETGSVSPDSSDGSACLPRCQSDDYCTTRKAKSFH